MLHIRSCAKTFFKRVETHGGTFEAKKEEIRYLKRQFSLTGYPKSFMKKTRVIPYMSKQSPAFSSRTESELPFGQQEHYAVN